MPQAKYQVRLLKIAEEDFTEIVSFIAVSNVDAANSFADQIKKKIRTIICKFTFR